MRSGPLPGESPRDLTGHAVSGAKWTGSSAAVNGALAFLQTAVAAYFLSPADFGLMSMAMVVVGFANLFADIGLSSAIVYRRQPSEQELASLYWTNVAFGAVVFAILQLGVPLFVELFREPRLADPLRLAAAVFLVVPFGQQHQFLLQKRLEFGILAKTTSAGYLAGAIVTIVLASRGFGVYALVIGHLANVVLRTVVLVATQWNRWRPHFHFAVNDLSSYLSFGLYQTGDRAANYFNVYLAHALIGSLLGARVLGYYSLAFELVGKPLEAITPVMTRVAFPIISLIREDRLRVKRGYLRMLQMLSAANFPLALGIAAIAPLAVATFYGNEWQPTVILVELLAVVALLRSTGSPVGALLLGSGKANWGFYWSASKMLLQLPGIYIGIRWGGAIGAAVAYLILQVLFSAAAYALLVRRLLPIGLTEYLACLVPSLILAAGMALAVRLTGLAAVDVPNAYRLVLEIAVGVATYAGLLLVFRRALLSDMLRLVGRRG